MLLGNSIKHPTDECIDGIIMFVLNLYCKNRPTDISNLSELQWHMFSKKGLESGKLPPTFSALKHTIHWSYYMTYIWKSAISTNPIYGRQTSAPLYLWQYLKMCSLCLFHFCSSLYNGNTIYFAHSVDSQNIWRIKVFFSQNCQQNISSFNSGP